MESEIRVSFHTHFLSYTHISQMDKCKFGNGTFLIINDLCQNIAERILIQRHVLYIRGRC